MGAGVEVRPGACAGVRGGGHDHRREQDHRRVQAEHRRDRGGEYEHSGQQEPRPSRAAPRQGRARRLEQPFLGAQVRQHQHGGQEADDRQQLVHLLPRGVRRHRADQYEQARRRYGRHRLGGAARPPYGEDQDADQQQEREDFGDSGTHPRKLQGRLRKMILR